MGNSNQFATYAPMRNFKREMFKKFTSIFILFTNKGCICNREQRKIKYIILNTRGTVSIFINSAQNTGKKYAIRGLNEIQISSYTEEHYNQAI